LNRARDSDSKTPGRLQILHYNIDRFPEIKDLRGLETLLVARSVFASTPLHSTFLIHPRREGAGLITSLMCFVDAAQDRANPSPTPSSVPMKQVPQNSAAATPAPPPKVITSDDFEDVSRPSLHLELMNRNQTLMRFLWGPIRMLGNMLLELLGYYKYVPSSFLPSSYP
jgi:hypothetical protein